MNSLSHLDVDGSAKMVDISEKDTTQRSAIAGGTFVAAAETIDAIKEGNMPKGDVLGTARLAGIMAAKKTHDLIPLCHPLALTAIDLEFVFSSSTSISVTASVKTAGKTGVEMEALTAVTVALLTLYDMAKALDKGCQFTDIGLLEKSGGKSGDYRASS